MMPLLLLACSGGTSTGQDENVIARERRADSLEPMVKAVCSSCHAWVPPDMLDKSTWSGLVLPVMAAKMGIYELDGREFFNEKNDPEVKPGTYPDKPTITPDMMRAVFEYFDVKAPNTPPQQERSVPIGDFTPLFEPVSPQVQPKGPPLTTFVDIRPEKRDFIVGISGKDHLISLFDKDLQPKWIFTLPSAPSWVDYSQPGKWLVTCMGSIMPSNAKEGKLLELDVPENGLPGNSKMLFSGLPRPVQAQRVRLGGNDILVNGFGHLWGQLFYYQNGVQAAPIKEIPGAIRSVVMDWNGDGLNDVITLFTQGQESIVAFINKGNGKFEEKPLLKFLPVYGSAWFELADMNGDGKKDIVYNAGDNADYSVVLKSFHGVYVYLNKGNDQFEQAWFYPVHGSYRTMIRDFDGDGDKDMVAISFFADYISQPEESLLYFENDGKLNFRPFKIKGALSGRWLTMDAGDVDGDGDEDVLLGNFSKGPESFMPAEVSQGFALGQPFMVLINKSK